MKKDVMVTVIITAYNHEKYIEQAIQGILGQKTEYEYELVIHDDASTDGTQDIIRAYEKKYPDKVKSIIEKENLFSQGKLGAVFYDSRLAGKYLAICDGDDYWTCDTKLQKQISYLEQHPECSMCIHNAIQHNSVTGEDIVLNTFEKDGVYDQRQQILAGLGTNFPASASYVMRNDLIKSLPAFFVKPRAVDYPVRQYLASKGEVYYFSEPMSVYRIMSSHSYMKETAKSKAFYNNYTVEMLAFFEAFNEYTNFEFQDILTCKMNSDYYGFCSSIDKEEGIVKADSYGLNVDKIRECYRQLDEKSLSSEILELSERSRHLFIYGISRLALICKKQMENAGVEYEGFVVSDGQIKVDQIEGKSVRPLSAVLQQYEDAAFILAVQPVNLDAIEHNLQQYHVVDYCKPFLLK